MKTDRLVVLAAGSSTRMSRSLGRSVRMTKCMIPVGPGKKPFLHHLLSNAEEAGFTSVVLATAQGDTAIRDHFSDCFGSMELHYVVQMIPQGRKKPFGTADALLQVLRKKPRWPGRSFCVCNSDNIYSISVLESVRNSSSLSAMPCYHRGGFRYPQDRTKRFAVVKLSLEFKVEGLVEKPDPDQIVKLDTSFVSMNLFKLETDLILPCLERIEPSVRGEKELPSAVNLMIEEHPGCMAGLSLSEHVPDLTSAEDIESVGWQ